jgi:hypothetical protein
MVSFRKHGNKPTGSEKNGVFLQQLINDWLSNMKPWQRKKIFSLASTFRPALEPVQPPVKLVPSPFPGGEAQLGHDADHSPPSNAEVKKK